VHAAFGGELEQAFGSWRGMMQPIERPMRASGALVSD